jgi:ABC-type spermidine/putrescine transport system permease subunit I
VRRHVFERPDGEVLKYDQFGAHAARIAPARWRAGLAAEDTVLHTGSPDEHDPRPLAASYWLAVPAAAGCWAWWWCRSCCWSGCRCGAAAPSRRRARSPSTTMRKFFANQTYIKLACTTVGHTATLMAVTGVLGYCIAYFLTMKVKSPLWRLALFLAFIIPFWTSTLIRAIAWVPFLGSTA